MPIFKYVAKNAQGKKVEGSLEAADEASLASRLQQQKLTLQSASAQKREKKGGPTFFQRLAGVSTKDLTIFSRQFATMINAGLPVLQCLTILADQTENKMFRSVVLAVRGSIEGGTTLSEALSKHPRAFDTLYVNMVRAGETGGILDVILDRLALYLEKAEALKGKIKSAMVYPAVVSTAAIGITLFLLTVVIPVFRQVFESFGHELPLPTQILLNLSDFVRHNFLMGFGVLIAVGVGVYLYVRTPKGKWQFDKLQLKLPVLGPLIRKAAVARFTRTLGTLIKSGVPILEALDVVGKTAGNKVIEKAIFTARDAIRTGERMSEPLKAAGVFPPMVTHMVAVGEETGALDTLLIKAADFYEQEVDTAVAGLTSIIEPILIIFMGLVIGSIVIAMFMPMFEMGNMVS